MTDQKSCNIKNCQCPHHQNEADFVITDVIEVDSKNSANFQIPKKHLGDVEKVVIKKNTKTMKKKVELFGNAKPEPQPKKPKKPPTDQQIIEQLADLNHKFEFIVEQFQILNQTVQNESQKNEKRWKKIEQKVDAGFAQVNQRLDKIENCPTIKRELAEQNEQINNLDANESKSDETDKSSTNDKKNEENN